MHHNNQLKASTPGRICLFGEHQDYLHLPVITAAIDVRITITGNRRADRKFVLDLPDIGKEEVIDLDQEIKYKEERDYLRSSLNVLLRQGVNIPYGYDCLVRGNIPINSGTSSSSALIVTWIGFLLTIVDDQRTEDPVAIARLAHQAEVLEFNEPGGMMDHFATSCGNVLYIEFADGMSPRQLSARPGTFVLGDSREPKDTKGILSRVKGGALNALEILKKNDVNLSMQNLQEDFLRDHEVHLSAEQFNLLQANIRNREITQQALALLEDEELDHRKFGQLLNAHQTELRDSLRISTHKIDRMIEESLKAGALGAKINGSGGGGCMFAYAPDNPEKVVEAILRTSGVPYVVKVDKGISIEKAM